MPTQEYLFNYFFHLAQTQEVNKEGFENWLLNPSKDTPPINIITVREDENEADGTGNYHIDLAFSYIETTVKSGSIGKVNTVSRSTVINSPIPFGSSNEFQYESSYMLWEKQTSPGIITELKVVGLKQINYIYKSHTIDTSLEDSLSEDNDDFNIPINANILDNMTLLRQTDVMNDSIRLCFRNSYRSCTKFYYCSYTSSFS